eukprot:1161201-Pelagomonas_calceolata.AAC.2
MLAQICKFGSSQGIRLVHEDSEASCITARTATLASLLVREPFLNARSLLADVDFFFQGQLQAKLAEAKGACNQTKPSLNRNVNWERKVLCQVMDSGKHPTSY